MLIYQQELRMLGKYNNNNSIIYMINNNNRIFMKQNRINNIDLPIITVEQIIKIEI